MSASINQNYMAAGWNANERQAARDEGCLAHPQWERNMCMETMPGANQACASCDVHWHSSSEFSQCWACGEPTDLTVAPWVVGRQELTNTRGQYQYDGQPPTPASGCGCDDATVSMVAKLLADGADLHAACLEVYGDIA